MTLRFLQLDVFTDRAGGGNPLGVVVGADGWPLARMQALAGWLDLVETTFLLPPTQAGASYRVRIFTPRSEIPFAGHPTIGSAHAAIACGRVDAKAAMLVQECAAGLLPIRVLDTGEGRKLAVQAPRVRVLERGVATLAGQFDALAGWSLGALEPALVEGGRRWWLVELASEAALRSLQPDHAAIAELARRSDSLGLTVFARCADANFDLAVRAFPAGVGIVEDPASGAANGMLAAYIAAQEPAGPLARGYRVSQGREIGRDARIDIAVDDDGAVWVGGQVHTVIDGALHWPADR